MKDYLLILVSTIRVQGDPLANRIDQWLPQTQCGQCGFAGCRPYATAIAAGQADINQCPPGGAATIQALAELLGREPKPLNLEHGAERPKRVAVIDEQRCIGCTLCIQACPVDAIIGAAKLMHTVIAQECTGCERCLPPCPVDCIRMEPAKGEISARQQADTARQRHEARLLRLEREKQEREAKLRQQKAALQASPAGGGEDAARQAAVAAAVARAKAKKAAAGTSLAAPVTVEATTAPKAVTAPVAETSD